MDKQVYEFGPYRIDAALNRLERAGATVPLPPKTFDLLLVLVCNHDRVVSKSELIALLWPGTFVEEANLTQHIYTLRKALGDQPGGRPYIETSARRGYRLAADVRTGGHERAAATRIPAVMEGERKHATILNCTVSNAAAVVERLGATGLQDVVRALRDAAACEVDRYGGVVNERHGEGLVALFGAPIVHEDDARRAILAALGIRRRVRELNTTGLSSDDAIDVQFGIDSGPVIISGLVDGQHAEYAALGQTVHTAALLQQFAQPGDILVTEATRRAAERDVAFEGVAVPLGAAIAAHRVVGTTPHVTVAESSRVLVPFVGREREIALLDHLFAGTTAGSGQIVGIVGEPGMGKSRLVYEFTRGLAQRPDHSSVLEGRCVSYGDLIPYVPLIEVIQALCGIRGGDPPGAARQTIERVIEASGLSAETGAWVRRVLGILEKDARVEGFSAEAVKARTFDALRLLLLNAAASRPLVVVVEDVHWIDRTSEEFLAALAERLTGARVMIVATYRPGYTAPWMRCSYATQITLAPLTRADSTRIVESVAGDRLLQSAVSEAILNRGEGNPFFLEELAHTVFERDGGPDGIPQTVRGVIMARIDRLPEPSKQVLQTAAVLGREVGVSLLTRVCREPSNTTEHLLELCRQEFLYERAAGDEPAYVFKHALTQDVAYDSLLARTRRELHVRAAHALEDLFGDRADDVAATLAYHYARTDLLAEAVEWLTRAADRAARVYANAEAMLHLDLAARRVQRLPEGPARDRRMLEIALRQAYSLYFLGRFRDSVDVLRPHEARLARLNDAAMTGAFSFWLAHMHSRLGDQVRAQQSAHRAIDAATAAGDEVTLGKAHGLLSLEGHWAGTPGEGVEHGTLAVQLLRKRADERWWLGMAHFYQALNHLITGEFDQALDKAAEADAVGVAIGDPRLQTYAAYASGWIRASRGDHDRAIADCHRAIELAPDRVSRAYASMFLGYALVESDRHVEARAPLDFAVGELESFGFPQWHALALILTGEVCRRQGQLLEASSLVDRGLDVATRAGYWYAVGLGQRGAGRVAHDRGDLEDADRCHQLAMQTFDRIGAAFERARTQLELAEHLRGQVSGVRGQVSESGFRS